MERQLKNIRKLLFEKLMQASEFNLLFDFQIELAEELKRCERLQKLKKDESRKAHMHLLRCYGDSLSWRLLHPHAIRQLAKNQKNKTFLIDQGKGFDKTIEIAKGISKYNFPLIIADLTNCIRIGDIIICRDPELPDIIECKSGKNRDKYELQGRRGRQFSKMKGTSEYLSKGQAKVFGDGQTRLCVEIDSPTIYNWDIINTVLIEAEKIGEYFYKVSEYEIIGAVSGENEIDFFDKLKPEDFKFNNPLVGTHYRAIEEAWPTISPPANWGIEDRFKFPLMEGDLIIVHIFDPHVFIGFENETARITGLDSKICEDRVCSGIADFGYEVEIQGEKIILSQNFTARVLYGFETVESIGKLMLEFAQKSTQTMEKYINEETLKNT